MASENKKYFYEILEFIDTKLALSNTPLNQRCTYAAMEFVTNFVSNIKIGGKVINDFNSDFLEKRWFQLLYDEINEWYSHRYGKVLKKSRPQGLIGVISIYNTPFKVVVPTSIRGESDESGSAVWFTLPNSVLTNENIIEWLPDHPNLDSLSPEEMKSLHSDLAFVGNSLRGIYVNIMTADKQGESRIEGMASGIIMHLENAANDILKCDPRGVTYSFWELHLAIEKSIKTLLLQQGSVKNYHHDLKELYLKAKTEFNINISCEKLLNFPSEKEVFQYRYGEITGTTSEYAILIYRDVLDIVSVTTKALKRTIAMNNASFLLKLPRWKQK